MKRPRHVLESRVARVLNSAGLARPHGPLLVAVSGGPDSTALLRALVSLQADIDLPLHVVHVDHLLRPDSAGDATYTRHLAQRWGLPSTVRSVDVRRLQTARGVSLEDAARQARYAVLARVAAETGAAAVFTGHTADDQTETVLLALLRGSGLRGIAGMETIDRFPPMPDTPATPRVPLVRPLLTTTRADVETYLRARRLRPRRDPTNVSPEFLRNRVRAELVPLLEDLRPGASEAVRRAARAAHEALEFLQGKAEETWPSITRKEKDVLFLRLEPFSRLPAALRTLILQMAVQETGDLKAALTARHLESMSRLLDTPVPGRALHLPHGLRVTVLYGEAVLTQGDPPCPLPTVEPVNLALPGETAAGGWRFRAVVAPGGGYNLEASVNTEGANPLSGSWAIQIDGPSPSLAVRSREPGDRIRLPRGSRKVQDVLTDVHIPRSWRERVPVVVDTRSGEILWVVGVTPAAAARPVSPRAAEASRIST